MNTARKPTDGAAAPPDLITAAKSGDRLETLIALRDLLAERLQNTGSSRDISSISRRLMQCISEIETLEKQRNYVKEHPLSLSEFRRKNNLDLYSINQQHKLNKIDSEHEVN